MSSQKSGARALCIIVALLVAILPVSAYAAETQPSEFKMQIFVNNDGSIAPRQMFPGDGGITRLEIAGKEAWWSIEPTALIGAYAFSGTLTLRGSTESQSPGEIIDWWPISGSGAAGVPCEGIQLLPLVYGVSYWLEIDGVAQGTLGYASVVPNAHIFRTYMGG